MWWVMGVVLSLRAPLVNSSIVKVVPQSGKKTYIHLELYNYIYIGFTKLSLDQICRSLLCCNLEDTHLYGTQGTFSAASVSPHSLFSLDLSSFRFYDFSFPLLFRLFCYCSLEVFSLLRGQLHYFTLVLVGIPCAAYNYASSSPCKLWPQLG